MFVAVTTKSVIVVTTTIKGWATNTPGTSCWQRLPSWRSRDRAYADGVADILANLGKQLVKVA